MKERAVIFDVDGVLVDSYRPHFQSWVQLFHELGYDYSEEEFRIGFGRTSAEVLADWGQRHGVDLSAERIREMDDRKEALYRDVVQKEFPPIECAAELIDALYEAGFRLGVGSSGPPENVAVVMQQLSCSSMFQAVVTRVDIERGKPEPDVFLVAAKRLGVPPSGCVVVEDAVAGINAANRAGMFSIGLVGTTTRDNLAAANLVVESLCELTPEGITELIDAA